jgi:SNF2 family DNA or RNA helicase
VFTPDTSLLFKEAFCLSEGKVQVEFLEHAKKFLDTIMLRRLKDSPLIGCPLPSKTEVTLVLPLSDLQRRLYQNILDVMDNSLLKELSARLLEPMSCSYYDKGYQQHSLLQKGQNVDMTRGMEKMFSENKQMSSKSNSRQARNVLMELRKVSLTILTE